MRDDAEVRGSDAEFYSKEIVAGKYETIAFDLGNTLVRFDHSISAKKMARLCHLDSQKLYDTFFDSEITHLFEKGEISLYEFHQRASRLLGLKIPQKAFFDIWNDVFWEDQECIKIAKQLRKNYKLFLLSNTNRSHYEFIDRKFGITGLFDEVVLSYLVGAMKPDRKIFEHVIALSGGDRTKLVYIDDREDLIKEAGSMGIESIRYEGAEKLTGSLERLGIKINS